MPHLTRAPEPAVPCPKCGAKEWSGPRFATHPKEHLSWKCECGFVGSTPCLDAATFAHDWERISEPHHQLACIEQCRRCMVIKGEPGDDDQCAL